MLAEGFVFTLPAIDGLVAVVPALETIFLTGGLGFITVFLGGSSCRK